jgi:aminodeoxyfutalosine deaminase
MPKPFDLPRQRSNSPLQLYRARYLLPIATPPLEDGALLVENGRIAAVGPFEQLRQTAAEVIDFGEAILLPPLVNAHTHLELSHFPRWAAAQEVETGPAPFIDWLQRIIRVKRRLEPEQYHHSVAAGISMSLAAGTGAVGDILSRFAARAAYWGTALRGRFFLETLGLESLRHRRLLDEIGSIAAEGRCGGLEPGLSPHSPYTLTARNLREAFALARRWQLPTAIHLAETAAEVAFLQDSQGELAEVFYPFVGWQEQIPRPARLTPAAYLARQQGLGADTLLVHGVQVTAADIELIAAAGATVVLCPRSNAHLHVGCAPIARYLAAGVPLALGTDSLSSSPSLSVWDELAFARQWFAEAISCQELLTAATRNGAAALGLTGEMGVLAAGWGGNFQVLQPTALPPLADLHRFLCGAGRTAEVAALYLDGRDVLQND